MSRPRPASRPVRLASTSQRGALTLALVLATHCAFAAAACGDDGGSRDASDRPTAVDSADTATPSDAPPSDAPAESDGSPAEAETTPPADPIVLTSTEATVTIRTATFGVTIANAAGQVVLQTVGPDPQIPGDTNGAYGPLGATHRELEITPPIIEGFDHIEGIDGPWRHGSYVVAAATPTPNHASLDLASAPGGPAFMHVDITLTGADVHVAARVVPEGADGAGLNKVGHAFVLAPDEHFFGLGERFLTVDHRGRFYDCWTEEGGVPLGESALPADDNPFPNGPNMTHLPIPFFLSTKGYGLWIDTTFRTGFALGSDADNVFRIEADQPALDYHVMVHAAPRDTIAHFTSLTGRAKLPAPWVFGPRRRTSRTHSIEGVLETDLLRQRKVPTTMVDDTRHFLPVGSHLGYEDVLSQWAKDMHAQGYKVIGYFNAYVSVNLERTAHWVDEARAKGYFVKLADGSDFETAMISSGPQIVATIDMSNPEAVVWYQSILQQALDLGYDGWMLDFGEYLPPDALLFDGRTGLEAHNDFPILYQKATWDYMTRVRGNDFMYFARAGYTGTQALTPIVWSGDPSTSFDDAKGLAAQVRGGLNAGISGIPFWGSDISGYTCLSDPPADKEVYLRWVAFGAFCPDMHDENACAQAPAGAPPKWTVWSDAETTTVYGDYARLHTRLIPYLYAAAKEATETGMPVMRHPVLLHPESPAAIATEFDYYFGPALYVAPVVRRGATSRTLWLPPGRWVDFWTNAPLVGDQSLTRDAPLAIIPVYLKSGGIVAMLDPAVETLAPDTRDDVTSMFDVAGIFDLRAAIDRTTGTGAATLVDGTHFAMSLAPGAVSLPVDVPVAADDAELARCARCGRIDDAPDGAKRVRLSLAATPSAEVHLGGLTLTHTASAATRVRWDVIVVDP